MVSPRRDTREPRRAQKGRGEVTEQQWNLHEIVEKMIGPITPVASQQVDDERFENLKALCRLTEDLVRDLDRVAMMKGRYEASVKRAGEYADTFMTERLGIPDEDEEVTP